MTTVTFNQGKLIKQVNAVAVFIRVSEDDWIDSTVLQGPKVPPPIVCEIACFIRDLVTSAYMDLIGSEYSAPGKSIGRGSFGGAYVLKVTPPAVSGLSPEDVRDQDIKQAILDAINLNTMPAPLEDTCYIVIAPGEVLWRKGLTGTSEGGGGYHGQIGLGGARSVAYCVIGNSATATFSQAISHELVEMITDTDTNGWVDRMVDPGQEVADLCFPQTVAFHGSPVSTFWSRSLNKCVGPADDTNKTPCLKVDISGGVPYCNGGNQEGATVSFAAHPTIDGHAQPALTYFWSATNAQIVGSLTGSKVDVIVPNPAGPFNLSVSVTDVNGCQATGTRDFASVTPKQSQWFQLVCNLLRHLRLKYPVRVNPLWDPLRDLVLQPPTEREVADLREFSDVLNRLVKHLEAWRDIHEQSSKSGQSLQ